VTLGVFVATFVYSVLVLGSIASDSRGKFVPHLSTTVAEALLLVNIAVLIYFIHHIAKSIQLPEVIAGIARDLTRAIDAEFPNRSAELPSPVAEVKGRSVPELLRLIDERGGPVPATSSGYLQFVGYAQLVDIAARMDAVIRLDHRPGHFLIAGRTLATVWPQGAAQHVGLAIAKAHVTGPHRTLMQDPVFAIDQLVEIAIRALSPAVNDTFTALTCIDWLSAGLSRISGRTLDEGVYRDRNGQVRLIESDPSYARMAAVLIRLIDSLNAIMLETTSDEQRRILARQAKMILLVAEETVPDPNDREDIRVRYERTEALADGPADPTPAGSLG
jgi:uncharacterized membrane protein